MSTASFPAIYLYPVHDTWATKRLTLSSTGTKLARDCQTNGAIGQMDGTTVADEGNGLFPSKVLSRRHALVWEEGGKIFIKDTKSTNGTFVNGTRLSDDGEESAPFELKSGDVIVMGHDVFSDDKQTIVHHKITALVACVFSDRDVRDGAYVEEQAQARL